jgi:hypothetical protein
MRKWLFVYLFLAVGISRSLAQFPTFYPTYQGQYTLGSRMVVHTEKLKAASTPFLNSINRDSLSIHVSSAPQMAILIERVNHGLELEIDELELKIKSSYSKQVPSIQDIQNVANWQEEILQKKKLVSDNIILIDYYKSINSFLGKPDMAARFFPVTNRNEGDFFYNNVSSSGFSILNSFVIQASENGGAANAEIVSGQIAAVRVSFSSVIQGGGKSTDSLEVNTKLFNGGGITNLHFDYPVFYYHRQNVLFYSAFKPGFVADIPVFGSELARDAFSGYADLALEFLTEIRTDGGEFSLFANFKGSYIAGTPTFYSTLKSPENILETQKLDKPFWISQVYVGVSVSKQFRISANIPIATTRLIQMPDKIQIGIQVTPDSEK